MKVLYAAAALTLASNLAQASIDLNGIGDVIQSAGITNFELSHSGLRPRALALVNPRTSVQSAPTSTALLDAIGRGDLSGVKAHLDQINISTSDGSTSIMSAALLEDASILELLLAKAGTDLILAKDNDGNNALNWAVLAGRQGAIDKLLEKGAFDASDRRAAWTLAQDIGHPELHIPIG